MHYAILRLVLWLVENSGDVRSIWQVIPLKLHSLVRVDLCLVINICTVS